MRMDTVKKKLGYTVRSERERLGLSQSSLAERAGVSTRTISDIETCNGNPELATLIPLTQYLRISIDFLYTSLVRRASVQSNFFSKKYPVCSILLQTDAFFLYNNF